LPTPFAKHEKRGRWAWPITAAGDGRVNFGPPGPAGAEKKNGWARAIEKERTLSFHYSANFAAAEISMAPDLI